MIRSSYSTNLNGRGTSFITFLSSDNLRPYDEKVFVGCAAYIRSTETQGDILIQAPLEWHERYGNVMELKRWAKHIELLGGSVSFQGVAPYKGTALNNYKNFVLDWNRRALQGIWHKPNGDDGQEPKAFVRDASSILATSKGRCFHRSAPP